MSKTGRAPGGLPPRNGDDRESAPGRKPKRPRLHLMSTEPAGRAGVSMVFESGGREYVWLLEQTTVAELLASLLNGRMRKGGRVVVDAEVTLEPPERKGGQPQLSFAAGHLQTRVPADDTQLKSLRDEIDRYLKQAR